MKPLLNYFCKNGIPIDLEFKIGLLKFVQKGTLQLEKENHFKFTNSNGDNKVSFNLAQVISIAEDRPHIIVKT